MRKFTFTLALILVAVISVTKVSDWASDPANHQHAIESTNNNISTVLKLSAATAAVSVGLTVLPGDTGSSVADQLADMAKYFLVILSALYLEKYLITLTGYISFTILVPIVCLLLIGRIWLKKDIMMSLALKILVFAGLIYCIVPASVKVSDIIYETQEASISSTLDELNNFDTSEDETIIDKITGAVTSVTDRATAMLSNLIESVAVLVVTSCIIPILVFLCLAMMCKLIFNIQPAPIDPAKYIKLLQKEQNHEVDIIQDNKNTGD